MANAQAGTIVVGDPQNLSGILFQKTNPETPLFNRLRDFTTNHRIFITGASYSLQDPGAVEISEDDSMLAPAPKKTSYLNANNRTQIFQRTVQETYRSMGNQGELSAAQPSYVGLTNNRPNKLQTEKVYQLQEMRRDIEWAILNNEYHESTGTDDADQTRGLLELITTNVITASGAPISYDMLCDIGEALTAEYPDGLERVTMLCDATIMRQLANYIITSDKFVGSQTQFGAGRPVIATPFGNITPLQISNKFLPTGTVVFADLNVMGNVVQPTPGKGAFFYEPLAKTGASEHGQIYGEWGLDHGPEFVHAKITGLSTVADNSNYGKSVIIANALPLEVNVANDALNVLIESDAPGTGAALTAFSIGGVGGTIDESNKTVAITVPADTDVETLVANFTVSDGADVWVGITAQASGVTINDFTSPVVYRVVSEDDLTAVEYTVTVTIDSE